MDTQTKAEQFLLEKAALGLCVCSCQRGHDKHDPIDAIEEPSPKEGAPLPEWDDRA